MRYVRTYTTYLNLSKYHKSKVYCNLHFCWLPKLALTAAKGYTLNVIECFHLRT